jgi:hypothetical protein
VPAPRRLLAGLLLTLPVLLPVAGPTLLLAPAAASTSTPAPDPASVLTASPTGAAPASTAGQRTSSELDAEAARQQAELDQLGSSLARAAAAARTALEQRQTAERAAGLADRAAAEQEQRLAAARATVARARDGLDGFAGALYRDGGTSSRLSYFSAALETGDPGSLLHDVELAQAVGEDRSNAYDDFRTAAGEQRAATMAAQAAQAKAAGLRAEATAADARARSAVTAQTVIVAQRRTELMQTIAAADDARHREGLLAQAEKIAAQRSRAGVPASALAGALVPRPTATCTGGDLAGFPNGRLPEQALCALWGTTGQVLRADAAAAFNDLSRAYAEEHGAPLCVTDSYRNLDEQVAVRAAKPTLAAVPGHSNHGWGVAVDLCGGVQSFTDPAHVWLLAHAAEFGWFHPGWAEPTGVKPEAWHWEFAG